MWSSTSTSLELLARGGVVEVGRVDSVDQIADRRQDHLELLCGFHGSFSFVLKCLDGLHDSGVTITVTM